MLFALLAADGGLVLSLQFPTVEASVFITGISFTIYLLARTAGAAARDGSRYAVHRRPVPGAKDLQGSA